MQPPRQLSSRTRASVPLLALTALAAPLVLPRAHAAPVPQEDDPNEELIEAAGTDEEEPKWIALFNGVNLDGWTPKIRTYALGENFADTFRVEDGLLKIGFDGYGEDFGNRFGHLFFEQPYSHYRLRIAYRFVGEQAEGGPGWALRNSGVMLHCQDPATMAKDQEFPVSIEAQMLGGNGEDERTTANLCTPGTHVVIDEELVKRHCTNSTSATYHGSVWVTMDLEVRGGQTIRHWMEDRIVLEYHRPQLDPNDAAAKRLLEEGADEAVTGGYIALQAESHPLEIRSVELLPLEDPDEDDAVEAPGEGDRGGR